MALNRHMNIPLIVEAKIVLAAGAGNKAEPDIEKDVQLLALLMEVLAGSPQTSGCLQPPRATGRSRRATGPTSARVALVAWFL